MMKHTAICTTTLATLFLFAASAGASPDEQDDAIKSGCPSASAWIDQQRNAHADRSENAIVDRDAQRIFTMPEMRSELLRRAKLDTSRRSAWIAAGLTGDNAEGKAVYAMDGDNLTWLKPLVVASGFPTIDEVGEQGVSAAWLLVQHADRDSAFQKDVLDQVKPRVAQGQIKGSDYAMLTDRVMRAQGKPQLYGSQMVTDPAKPGEFVLQPTADMAHLDKRRARVGFMPIRDYKCALRVFYTPAPARSIQPSKQSRKTEIVIAARPY